MPLLRWHTEADGARTVYPCGIARSGGGRAEAAKPAYRVPPGTCTTGHEKHQNLEKTWRTSSKTRRIFIASDPGRRPHARPDATHPTPGAVSTSTTRPAPGARLAPPARPWPGTLPLAARPRPTRTPGPATRGTRRPARSHPPTRARPRRPGRGPHASPSVAGRTRTHRAPRSRSAPDLPRTATPDGIGCDPSPPPPSPRRAVAPPGGRAARAGCASRDRVLTAPPAAPVARLRRPHRAACAPPLPSGLRAGPAGISVIRQQFGGGPSDAIRQTITHLTRSRPHGTHPAPAPGERPKPAHRRRRTLPSRRRLPRTGRHPYALVAPLSSPPVSRVSIYSCTAVSVTLNHTRHLLLSARLSLAARLCVRASQAGRWSRVAAGGWLEVEVAISPVHL